MGRRAIFWKTPCSIPITISGLPAESLRIGCTEPVTLSPVRFTFRRSTTAGSRPSSPSDMSGSTVTTLHHGWSKRYRHLRRERAISRVSWRSVPSIRSTIRTLPLRRQVGNSAESRCLAISFLRTRLIRLPPRWPACGIFPTNPGQSTEPTTTRWVRVRRIPMGTSWSASTTMCPTKNGFTFAAISRLWSAPRTCEPQRRLFDPYRPPVPQSKPVKRAVHVQRRAELHCGFLPAPPNGAECARAASGLELHVFRRVMAERSAVLLLADEHVRHAGERIPKQRDPATGDRRPHQQSGKLRTTLLPVGRLFAGDRRSHVAASATRQFLESLRQCFLDARRAHHQNRLRLDPLPVELPAERDGARILHLHRGVHQRQRHAGFDRRRAGGFPVGIPAEHQPQRGQHAGVSAAEQLWRLRAGRLARKPAAHVEPRPALRVCHPVHGNARKPADPGVCGRAQPAAAYTRFSRFP